MTFVSIEAVVPRHIPVVHASTSAPPSCPFRFLNCRFPCTSQRDSPSARPSRAYPRHLLSNCNRSPARTPSRRRTSRGMVICPLLVTFACFFFARLHFLIEIQVPYFCQHEFRTVPCGCLRFPGFRAPFGDQPRPCRTGHFAYQIADDAVTVAARKLLC